ncbi:MAG: hypothetical protein ACXVAE_07370 [Candidatus Limnocylindrales bacterium]
MAATAGRLQHADWRELLFTAGGLLGWLFGVAAFVWVEQQEGGQVFRLGPDLEAYLRAGSALLAGDPVYVGQIGDRLNFPYAPPWAVIAAGLSLLPPLLVQAGVVVLDLLAIRFVAGSWRGAGWILLWPLTVFVISAGNIDLLIAAAVVLAWSRREHVGQAAPLTLMAFAKLAPALALPPARWREIALAAAVCVAVTLPVLGLWPEWIAYLQRQPASIAITLPGVPAWYWRLPVGLVLAALGSFVLRRPWLSALAVVVAMPSLYLSTTVILIAPIRLWLDERRRT